MKEPCTHNKNNVPRKVNAIEAGQDMNCLTCKIEHKCRYTYRMQAPGKQKQICRYYYNPDNGCYDDSGKNKVRNG